MTNLGRGAGLGRKWGKYAAVGAVTVKQQLQYRLDFVFRAMFLLLILYVFIQLWRAAYGGGGNEVVAGFTLKMIVWYLVFTEAVTMACPPLCVKVEDEVKSGDIALRLIRPQSYVGFHYMTFVGEAAVRFTVQLAAGSAIAWAFMGPPSFGWGWAELAVLLPGALSVAFLLNMAVALCAFWVEETRGMEFVLHKLQFTVGGMLLPLELMPEWLQRICAWLPFQAMLYLPARAAVVPEPGLFAGYAAIQWAWAAALAAVCALVYRKGVRRLHVNGG